MSAICIIPARGGSKGIPRKNLLPICGRPLVDWSLLCAAQSGLFEKVLLSSDDDEILARAKVCGATPLRRPAELSSDTATSEAALVHAIEQSGVKDVQEVVFLQPTSPLRAPTDLRGGLETFRKGGHDSLFSSALIEDWFVWEIAKGELESVTYDWRTRKRRQDLQKRYLENGSFYIFKLRILLETGNRMGGLIGTHVMESWKALEIDSRENIDTAQVLMQHKLFKEWPQDQKN